MRPLIARITRRDLVFNNLVELFLGNLEMLNILGLTRFLQLGQIGTWPIVVAVGALPIQVPTANLALAHEAASRWFRNAMIDRW